eukprot:1136857-Pelagomonas_calceolata.AAC.2
MKPERAAKDQRTGLNRGDLEQGRPLPQSLPSHTPVQAQDNGIDENDGSVEDAKAGGHDQLEAARAEHYPRVLASGAGPRVRLAVQLLQLVLVDLHGLPLFHGLSQLHCERARARSPIAASNSTPGQQDCKTGRTGHCNRAQE